MNPPKRIYTKRINSNGGEVYPTVCATQYKLPQQQADLQGQYILDYYKKVGNTHNAPPCKPK